MMPNLYARATALPDVAGRVDYISSPHRQEQLLAAYDGAADLLGGNFWKQLAKESQAAFKQCGVKERNGKKLKCCEGRELMIQLSNALLERMSKEEIVKVLADELEEKLGSPVAVGLHLKHYKEGPDNLHAHVILPERELLKEPVIKIAERALFFDAQGKRRYKKAEILDADGQLLPGCRIIKKGEIYEQRYFGSVDPKYSYKTWIKDIKTNVILPLRNGKLRGDVEITEFDGSTGKLPQQHIGTVEYVDSDEARETVAAIRAYNEQVRGYNQMIDAGYIQGENRQIAQEIMRRAKNRNETLPAMTKKLLEIRQKGLEQAREDLRQGKVIRARRDWKIQRLIDEAVTIRKVGAKTLYELEQIKKEKGRELGQAKREHAAALQLYGKDSQELQEAEQHLKESKESFVAVARVVETQRQNALDDLISDAEAKKKPDQTKWQDAPVGPGDR